MQLGGDHSNGRFNAMDAVTDSTKMMERLYQTDGSMPTHSDGGHVIEEQDARRAGRIGGLDDQGTYQDIRSSWFADDSAAKSIVVF